MCYGIFLIKSLPGYLCVSPSGKRMHCKSAWRSRIWEQGQSKNAHKKYLQQEPHALLVQVQHVLLCSGCCCTTTAHSIDLQIPVTCGACMPADGL